MALTKADIVQPLIDRNGCAKAQASNLLETLLELIKSDLANGNDVMISGFGKFNVNKKAKKARPQSSYQRKIDTGCKEGGDVQVFGETQGED